MLGKIYWRVLKNMDINSETYCTILNIDIQIPCNLEGCTYHFENPANLNCIKIYGKKEPLESEDISFITDLPIWIVQNLKREGLLNIKRLHLKEHLNKYKKIRSKPSGDDEINKLEKYYKANIRNIIVEAIQMTKSVNSLSKLLSISPQTVKNLIKLYIGNVEEVLPSVDIFRKIKHLPLGKKASHEPFSIETLFVPIKETAPKSKLNFRDLKILVQNLLE